MGEGERKQLFRKVNERVVLRPKQVDPQNQIPITFLNALRPPDSVTKVIELLKNQFSPSEIGATSRDTLRDGVASPHRVWELCGLLYKNSSRVHEAITIFHELYEYLLASQVNSRAHKGAPLCWLHDCYAEAEQPATARRYLMLTICEDALNHANNLEGFIGGGAYSRAVYKGGFSHDLVSTYVKHAWRLHEEHADRCFHPEWLLQQMNLEWLRDYPSINETGQYTISRNYVKSLLERLGSEGDAGRTLETLAHYLMGTIPGCRAYSRSTTYSTDLDVVGVFEGPVQDFRVDLGRYFACECKDWEKPADFSAFAKFSRVLDSIKSRFGILFSSSGISGEGASVFAEREQLKLFHDRGIVIVVITREDLEKVARGHNFLSMLRQKYERVRLDLVGK